MLILVSTIMLPLALGATARPDSFQNVSCVSGAHIVGVRATTEKPGFGVMEAIANELQDQIPDSDQYPIDYPAAGIEIIDNLPRPEPEVYRNSELKGYIALKDHLESYVTSCPNSKIVLMGYSQGAHVVGDALCGWYGATGEFPLPQKDPISDSIKSRVPAVIQFGDPTNNKSITWHIGNSTRSGLFPRKVLDKCGDIASRWQSYCDALDPFCATDPFHHDLNVHLHYVPEYQDTVVNYVVDKVGNSSEATYKL